MSDSLKDALEKAGVVTPKAEPKQDHKKWKNELPEEDDRRPYVPFDAPALTKPTETPRTSIPGKPTKMIPPKQK